MRFQKWQSKIMAQCKSVSSHFTHLRQQISSHSSKMLCLEPIAEVKDRFYGIRTCSYNRYLKFEYYVFEFCNVAKIEDAPKATHNDPLPNLSSSSFFSLSC